MKKIDPIDKAFSEALRLYIDTHKYGCVSELANDLKVAQSTVSNWARGERKASETQRRSVASIIGIPYDEMIGLKKSEEKEQTSLSIVQETEKDGDQMSESEKRLEKAYEIAISSLKDQIKVANKRADELFIEKERLIAELAEKTLEKEHLADKKKELGEENKKLRDINTRLREEIKGLRESLSLGEAKQTGTGPG